MRRSFVILGLCLPACAGGRPAPPGSSAAAPVPVPPPAVQAGYCERLMPWLEKSAKSAELGAKLSCLDVPGVTELGRFGGQENPEAESLAGCFENPGDYTAIVETQAGGLSLSLGDEFVSETGAQAGSRLGDLVPWLPGVSVGQAKAGRIRARVAIEDARFVTLVGLATRLQGQPREAACLRALCAPGTSYVQKALVGTPKVVLTAEDELGRTASLGTVVGGLDFEEKELYRGSRELSSRHPVTLAIARGSFRTAHTERLCRFCGRKGQSCCEQAPSCDGGLGCIAEKCQEVGRPGQPCDGESCGADAVCVEGRCEATCGQRGAACCVGSRCARGLRCVTNPDNFRERRVLSEEFVVEGGFFGVDEDRVVGEASCGPLMQRNRFAATKLGSGRGECARAWWFDPENEHDCRTAIHVGVSLLGSITCRVEVFAFEPPKPHLCLP